MPSKEIYVGIVGVGLVGSELVDQILSIKAERNPFKIVLLASSKKALYLNSETAVSSSNSWKQALAESQEAADLSKFAGHLTSLIKSPSAQAVIVDNTSSDDVASLYPSWLAQGVSVVTPNKKAFSGPKATWDGILAASQKEEGGRWLNESTVGAGLPVINTLKEMLGSGDRVRKIEGVFSGTMSYIFNNFSAPPAPGATKPKFSAVVREARELGYTEPHPADDLNGFDVARKLTILARTVSAFSSVQTKLPELGSFLDVQTVSLIPAPLEGLASGDEFVNRLAEFDDEMDKLRDDAEKEGQVLRFVGVVDPEAGIVKAGLEKYVCHFLMTFFMLTERLGTLPPILSPPLLGARIISSCSTPSATVLAHSSSRVPVPVLLLQPWVFSEIS